MKWLEYMENHPEENLSWCRAYISDVDARFGMIMYDGLLFAVFTPDGVFYRFDGGLTDEVIEQFARTVNRDYDLYSGYPDWQIARFALREVGCASCPYKCDCDAMSMDVEN